MNTEFKIKGNNVIVTTDNVGRITKELTNNIEEILITENNIEEIKETINSEKKKIENSKKKRKRAFINDIGLGALWLFNAILNLSLSNYFSTVCHFLCSAIWTYKGLYFTIIPENKQIKISEHSINALENTLHIEENKLQELKNDKTNDLLCITIEKKSIDTSEQIINLRNKLNVIHSYEYNKRKIIYYYKKGKLKEILSKLNICNKNYELIEELIKNDLNQNEEKQIENQKVLKRC